MRAQLAGYFLISPSHNTGAAHGIQEGLDMDKAGLMASSSSIVYQAPIGPLKLVANNDGVSTVKFLFGRHGDWPATRASGMAERSARESENKHLEVCRKWLDAYFDGTLLKSVHPPRPKLSFAMKSDFSHTVWETLVSTNIGETLSYKELASLSGNPKAARAVGRAVKSHSIPILVPCHRVVKTRGEPENGNYSGGDGMPTKVWLLEHEKRMVEESLVAEDSD